MPEPLLAVFMAFFVMLLLSIAKSIKIVRAFRRYAVFRLGRFTSLKGPGVAFTLPFVDQCVKISMGDQGILVAGDEVRMKEKGIPSEIEGSASIGQIVYVKDFRKNRIVVDAHIDQTRFVKCEKCGHMNVIG